MIMKKVILLLILLCSSFHLTYSQSITVDTNTHTVPQLVNNVLLNSPCLQVTNINWRTGTQFGSSNGIGYFHNTNPRFPLQSGVILSTGNVANAMGPNMTMQDAGSSSWIGDTDLEQTLANAGIPMSSVNATALEFEFTAMSPFFDFDFLFASEEYGNFQCQFSDAFAFLLTNMNTGVTTNLAVVPNTNTPISVVTIRDYLYNSICPSKNEQYFGTFNGGAEANASPTNFNGNTTVLKAKADLIPNVPYKIKLVIADREDPDSDSAIFLSANSFNIGQQVLGADLTTATGSAICNGGSHTIVSGLNPAEYSFVWKRNGAVINGATGPDLTVTQAGTYTLEYANRLYPCQTISDDIIVQFFQSFNTRNPKELLRCDTGTGTATFDLSENTSVVTVGLAAGTQVSYHATIEDANNNVGALPTTLTSGDRTIFVRIKVGNSNCFVVKSFELTLVPPPVAPEPINYYSCALADNPTKSRFVLNSQNPIILNGQNPDHYTVSFHNNLAGAINNNNKIALTPTTANKTIYIRIQTTNDASCFVTTTMNLIVLPLPQVSTLEDVIVCESYTLPVIEYGEYYTGTNATGQRLFPGDIIIETQRVYIYNAGNSTPTCANQSSFLVTIIDPESLDIASGTHCNSYILPGLDYGNYYTGPAGTGIELTPGSAITSSQTVYFYFVSPEPPFCALDLGFEITIINAPSVPQLQNVFDCTSYTLQPLSFGQYYDAPDGLGNQIPVGTRINTTQTLYIFGKTGDCKSESSFTVFIGLEAPLSSTECAGYTLPALPIGNYYTGPRGTGQVIPAGTEINTTQTIYVYATSQSSPNCTDDLHFTITITLPVIPTPSDVLVCDSYTLPALTIGDYYTGTNGTGTLLFAGEAITSTQTIYIYLNNGAGCENEKSFLVEMKPKPEVDSRSEIDACHNYVLTNLAVGNYYTGPNGTGTLLHGGDVITQSQLIYIYAELDGCTAESNFQVNIYTIEAHQPDNVNACDSYVLPTLPAGNFYYTASLGQNGTGTRVQPNTTITTTQTLYVYRESGERINCFDENTFTITIHETPVIPAIANVKVCNEYTLPVLTVGNYFTQPNGAGTQLNAGDVLTTSQTLYVYAQSATSVSCIAEKSFTIEIFNVDQLNNVTICQSYTLPALTVGRYFKGPNGTGGTLAAGSVITQSQTIYVFASAPFTPTCSDETSFEVTIIPTPVANAIPLAQRTLCDTDGTNDGIFNVTLSQFNATVLGTQTGNEFEVTYYETFQNATLGQNPITATTLQNVFVRVSNTLADSCFDVKPIAIKVNLLPEPTPVGGTMCLNSVTGEVINTFTIASGLSAGLHTFEWYLESELIPNATQANLTVTAPGFYSVVATHRITGCASEPFTVQVIASSPASIDFDVTSAFDSNQTITVNATGNGGDFEYQLDNGIFQDSPVFENVGFGTHIITVRDKNGCGITTKEVLIINYPKFFTPNGDGYNDTWNIDTLKEQPKATIFIYDRYGKLLTQIFPSKTGWNGTYNGAHMPSTDYWFTVTFEEAGVTKEFKAHFSLKR
jgi:gliding motility-associated-like protein